MFWFAIRVWESAVTKNVKVLFRQEMKLPVQCLWFKLGKYSFIGLCHNIYLKVCFGCISIAIV